MDGKCKTIPTDEKFCHSAVCVINWHALDGFRTKISLFPFNHFWKKRNILSKSRKEETGKTKFKWFQSKCRCWSINLMIKLSTKFQSLILANEQNLTKFSLAQKCFLIFQRNMYCTKILQKNIRSQNAFKLKAQISAEMRLIN